MTMAQIAKALGSSPATVYRYLEGGGQVLDYLAGDDLRCREVVEVLE
jgi:AcrR family transcriptional regulator